MKKTTLAFMATLLVFSTGCPHNNYEVTLTPRGDEVERTVQFYRSDGQSSSTTNSTYEPFDPEELASISAFYPEDGLTSDGDRHTVRGKFHGALPGDIGGAGWYRRLTTNLGEACFYVERFRGNDDVVRMLAERFRAADQLTDLVVGWVKLEFMSEPGFANLHQFIDHDFRQDLKNWSIYGWMGEGLKPDDSSDEYSVRFGQYLIEREYVTDEEAPGLIWGQMDDETVLCSLLQQLIARKLEVPQEQPMPAALVFIADPKALSDSWDNYITNTDAYREKLRIWENYKTTNPQAKKPDPDSVLEDLINVLGESGNVGGGNHLSVKLTLPSEPLRTNGKWDETNQWVVWESGLAGKYEISRLPVICYADWVAPREDFQWDHLGSVSLTGEELLKYCLWQTGLEEKKAAEWEQFLASLRPGENAIKKLDNFRFPDEPEQANANNSDVGKQLIRAALLSNR